MIQLKYADLLVDGTDAKSTCKAMEITTAINHMLISCLLTVTEE